MKEFHRNASGAKTEETPWSILEQEQGEKATRDEIEATMYAFGELGHPTEEERKHYAEIYDSGLRQTEWFQDEKERHLKSLIQENRDVADEVYAGDIEEKLDYTKQFIDRFSDDELSTFAERFRNNDEGCLEDFVKYTAKKLDISFADQISIRRVASFDEEDEHADMVWNDHNRDISISDRTFGFYPPRQLMVMLAHELFHAKQNDVQRETKQYVAESRGIAYDQNDYSDSIDNYALANMAVKMLLDGTMPDKYRRGALYCANSLNYTLENNWVEYGDSPENAFGRSPYRSQISEAEAYSFQEQMRERLQTIEPASFLETHATQRDRDIVAEAQDDALQRLFSPQDLLMIDDFIHDSSASFRALDSITSHLLATKRIEYLKRGEDFGNDYFGITIPEGVDTTTPSFKKQYFRQIIKYVVDMRANVIDTELFRNAYDAGEEPEHFISDFIDINALNSTCEPSMQKDVWTLALSASLDHQGYESGQIGDKLDAMTAIAKKSFKQRIKYALRKHIIDKIAS